MTPQTYPADLDSLLANKGYSVDAETSVQVLPLEKAELKTLSGDIQIAETLNDEWLDRFLMFNGYDMGRRAGFESIMRRIVLKTGFIDFRVEGKSIGCGLGVIEGEYVGLYDIVIAPDYRGQGYGKELVRNLLIWGRADGCKTAYLQVMVNNTPARNVYGRIGFEEVYRYWYRIKE